MTTPQFDAEQLRWTIRGRSLEHGKVVHLGGTEVPASFSARLQHPDWPADVILYVEVDSTRGPIAAGLRSIRRVDGDEPTPYREMDPILGATVEGRRLLRDVTADAVGQMVAQQWYLESPPVSDMSEEERESRISDGRERVRTATDQARQVSEPRRRRIISDSHLELVAGAYREAIELSLPPTKYVAARFMTSHSTAARWVRMARDAEVLGAAVGTKPGEAQG